MAYIDPKTVESPQKRIRDLRVLYDGEAGGWSAARLRWDGEERVGLRWNGEEGPTGVGNPQSYGHATWFIVPPDLADVLLDRIAELRTLEGYRQMAADTEREAEALEWSEALLPGSHHEER